MHTHFNITQPVPVGGAVQNTCIRVRLRGVLSVTAGAQLVINCVSSSSMIWEHKKGEFSLNIWKSSMLLTMSPWSLNARQQERLSHCRLITINVITGKGFQHTHQLHQRHPEEGTQEMFCQWLNWQIIANWVAANISPAKYDYNNITHAFFSKPQLLYCTSFKRYKYERITLVMAKLLSL